MVDLVIREDNSSAALREEVEELSNRNSELSSKLLRLNLEDLNRSAELRRILSAVIEVLEGRPGCKQLVRQIKSYTKQNL